MKLKIKNDLLGRELPGLKVGELNRLQRWSNRITGHYGGPTCLVGSACLTEDHRDVDVVTIISDYHFSLRYGNPVTWVLEGDSGLWTEVRWKWSRDCIKKWEHGCNSTRLNLDFKVIPESYYVSGWNNMPIYRLDSCTNF